MTITVHLTPDAERKLVERASQSGQDVSTLAGELLERAVNAPPTLDEILEPIRGQFAESGMTDDELAELVEDFFLVADDGRRQPAGLQQRGIVVLRCPHSST